MNAKSFCHIYGQLDQTGERIVMELEHLFGLELLCDTTFSLGHHAEQNCAALAELRRRGGLVAPNI